MFFPVPDFDLYRRFASNSMRSSLPMIVPYELERAESLGGPASAYQKKGVLTTVLSPAIHLPLPCQNTLPNTLVSPAAIPHRTRELASPSLSSLSHTPSLSPRLSSLYHLTVPNSAMAPMSGARRRLKAKGKDEGVKEPKFHARMI